MDRHGSVFRGRSRVLATGERRECRLTRRDALHSSRRALRRVACTAARWLDVRSAARYDRLLPPQGIAPRGHGATRLLDN